MFELFASIDNAVNTTNSTAREVTPAEFGASIISAGHTGPWVAANMVTSVDGASSLRGLSGGLGNTTDRVLLSVYRSNCDVIVVGASTASAEKYRRPSEIARAKGGDATTAPALCLVSRSLRMDMTIPAFNAPVTSEPFENSPVVLGTTVNSAQGSDEQTAAFDDIFVSGSDEIDFEQLFAALAQRFGNRILLEGGPKLLGSVFEQGSINELNVTVSPLVAGGDSPRIVDGLNSHTSRLSLAKLGNDDDHIFTRYFTHAS